MQKGKDKLEGAEDKVAWPSASSKITRDLNENGATSVMLKSRKSKYLDQVVIIRT